MSKEIAFVVMAAGIGSRYDEEKQLKTLGKDKLTIVEHNMRHALDADFQKFFFLISDNCTEIFHGRLRSFLFSDCVFGLIYQKKEE
jgi:CTP:molybdopterin cytidylyltransferase MocA